MAWVGMSKRSPKRDGRVRGQYDEEHEEEERRGFQGEAHQEVNDGREQGWEDHLNRDLRLGRVGRTNGGRERAVAAETLG